jgi:betaine-aldehyde dehydrogenase
LAAGNTTILKASEVAPLISLEYGDLVLKAGFPPGVVNVIAGAGEAGRWLVEHSGVDMVGFTGGTKTGSAIAATAGRLLKPVVLELGGKSPNIVFADADIKKAIRGTGDGIFSGGGQSCIAGSRIFVQENIFKEFLEGLRDFARAYRMGAPDSPDTEMGPLASFSHREHVEKYVEIGRKEGAAVVAGGVRPAGGIFDKGAYYPATVLTGVDNTARVCREEIFGPVAVVIPFKNEDDLLQQANDTEFGLASGIWTGDYKRAWRVARALRAGTVWINTYKQASISTAFGGFKQSGIGREKGLTGMRAYMEQKGIYWGMA